MGQGYLLTGHSPGVKPPIYPSSLPLECGNLLSNIFPKRHGMVFCIGVCVCVCVLCVYFKLSPRQFEKFSLRAEVWEHSEKMLAALLAALLAADLLYLRQIWERCEKMLTVLLDADILYLLFSLLLEGL